MSSQICENCEHWKRHSHLDKNKGDCLGVGSGEYDNENSLAYTTSCCCGDGLVTRNDFYCKLFKEKEITSEK